MKFASLLLCLLVCGIAQASPSSLIPMPAQLKPAAGTFKVDAGTPIVVAPNDTAARQSAQYLADLLARTRGLHLQITEGAPAPNAIVFQHDPHNAVKQAEGYTLDVTAQGIRIDARDDAGLFHGAVTLWQLLTPDAQQGAVQVPALHISDWPRFAWRGLMLDSARHFQSVDEVEGLLDQMAQHKLNVLHWHLTDDQGWRIEIKRYPELTNTGAWRTPPDAGHDGEPQRYGGFYTQQQIRDVVAYATARHITVVPEIDMPGHAQAAVASYPQFGVTGQRPPLSVDWGVNPYLYNVDDNTFQFIDNVLDEVLALFPSHYIHVGGDEAIKDQWKASAAVQAKIRALHLKDEDALQGWFIGRIGSYLSAHGRRLIGWDEILDGGVPADATVMSWRGTDGAIKAAKLGHDVVMSPAPDLYMDSVQSDLADEAAGRVPVRNLASVYNFKPIPAVLNATQAAHVLGAQANVWTEHMPTMQHVQHAVFPRLDALSEVTWSPAAAHNWHGFLARLPAQLARYDAQKIPYADTAFEASIKVDANAALKSGQASVTLQNQAGYGAIRYTIDGSVPDLHAQLYSKPFAVKLPVTIKAATFADNGTLLAAYHTRVLDRASLLSRDGVELPNCPGSDFRLRLQPTPDAASMQPVYAVNVFDTCQQWAAVPLDGVSAIRVEAMRLERNFALAHDIKLVVSRPHSTPYGELLVHKDRCDGAVLASMPLPDPKSSDRRVALNATLPAQHGQHLLCFVYTAPTDGALYALGRVSLLSSDKGDIKH
ncbi:beta-N-acetylhexosaminidase [Dyella acidiphila]|uniref:beta-N-acetylhexosaminidase n=1 Tax=Dyella acidiphila TaxID=2775866 RepID=A0ABR9G693_9GAMM|nr:family 20 glycosylhydrolase [Dyella acidiphila]MBE1159566.1 family 20 glycosylhydrolase [Dyella acidiphila]